MRPRICSPRSLAWMGSRLNQSRSFPDCRMYRPQAASISRKAAPVSSANRSRPLRYGVNWFGSLIVCHTLSMRGSVCPNAPVISRTSACEAPRICRITSRMELISFRWLMPPMMTRSGIWSSTYCFTRPGSLYHQQPVDPRTEVTFSIRHVGCRRSTSISQPERLVSLTILSPSITTWSTLPLSSRSLVLGRRCQRSAGGAYCTGGISAYAF